MGVKERVAIFIDGSNFYFKMRDPEIDLSNARKFDFNGFAIWLARDRKIVYKGYYVGAVRAKANDSRAQKLRRKQQQLFSHLTSKEQGIVIKRGDGLIEFDSVINLRPSQNNRSRGVNDPKIRKKIIQIVDSKITK